MKDDLISLEAAIEYLMTNMGWCDEDGYQVDDAGEKRTHIEDLINGVPSVPAVPLDKLCEWLAAENVSIPCHLCDHYENGRCSVENDMKTTCPSGADEWRKVLKKGVEG